MLKKFIFPLLILLIGPGAISQSNPDDTFKEIDDEFPGNLGVYIKHLGDDTTINYNLDRNWYLASTVKIPIGIAILQKVEEGEFSLDDELTLQESDFVDGSGDLMWKNPGTTYTISELLKRMIRDSDSTATDMLIRFLGEEELNQHIQERIAGEGIEHITTILQVRYDAYSEIHKNAGNLTNMDIIELKGVTPLANRYNELLRVLSVSQEQTSLSTIPDAFEKYYQRNLNSGELNVMGEIVENLAEGEYLNEEHTELILDIMKSVTTGDRRIKAGLSNEAVFAHKTGTQIGRACNIGLVYPPDDLQPVVVAACVEGFNELREAEIVFQQIGERIAQTWTE